MRNSVELSKGIILADIIKRQRGLCTVKCFSFFHGILWDVDVCIICVVVVLKNWIYISQKQKFSQRVNHGCLPQIHPQLLITSPLYSRPHTLNLLPTLTRANFLVLLDEEEEEEGAEPEVAVTSGNSCLMKSSLLTATICSRLAWRASLFLSRNSA